MKRRAVLLVLSVLVAAVGTGLIAVYVKNADNRALAGQRVVSVMVADKSIPKNTPADQLLSSGAGWVKPKQLAANAIPADALPSDVSAEALAGLGRAQITISPGQALSRSFFASTSGAAATTKADKDNTEILVPLSGPASASGLIQIGGETTVLVTEKGPTGKTNVLIPSAIVVSINGQEGDTASARAVTGADSTVGLSVTMFDAQRITWAQEHELSLYLVGQTPAADTAKGVGNGNMP